MSKKYKLGDNVILNNNGSWQIATLTDRKIVNGRRTFTCKTETGFEIPAVPTDDQTSKIYICSKKTISLIHKVKTNLTAESGINLR